jgi:hypothetical protein
MAQLATLAPISFPSGTRAIPAAVIPPALSFMKMTIDVSAHTNAATNFDLQLEISLDSGVNWQSLIGCQRSGGVLLDKNSQPVNTCVLSVGLPSPGSSARRIRGTFSVAGPITLGFTLEAT